MSHRPVRALVADDNPCNRKMLSCILQALGMDVIEVCDGCEAVEAVRQIKFDVILMDVAMPVMSGLAATDVIRKQENMAGADRANIVMVTSHNTRQDREQSRLAGADHHIAKPIQAADIVRALSSTDQRFRATA